MNSSAKYGNKQALNNWLYCAVSSPLRQSLYLLFILTGYLSCINPVQSEKQTYKWRTDSGTIGYSDVLPAEEANKKQTVLDAKGLKVREIERAKTKKELADENKKRRIAEQKREQHEQQQRADQLLLKSYRTENDLIRAQNAKIKSIEQSIELNQDTLSLHKSKINQLRHSAAHYERASRPIPGKLITQIKTIREIIKTTEHNISRKRTQQHNIKIQYRHLLSRYRQIKK